MWLTECALRGNYTTLKCATWENTSTKVKLSQSSPSLFQVFNHPALTQFLPNCFSFTPDLTVFWSDFSSWTLPVMSLSWALPYLVFDLLFVSEFFKFKGLFTSAGYSIVELPPGLLWWETSLWTFLTIVKKNCYALLSCSYATSGSSFYLTTVQSS